jgi:glyceraldehyde 3-phosphate dehydrogenase
MQDIFEICAINYRNIDLDYMAYMLKYDSVFGRYDKTVEKYDKGLVVDGVKIPVVSGDSSPKSRGKMSAPNI